MKNAEQKVWNAVGYLRLSRDDGDKEESNSITGQRELVREFIVKHPELHEVGMQVDDGYSGSSFERPAFKAMMEAVRSGQVNCIIVKDLSRFGRNYLDAGEYIEKIFPFLGVRFIAINDGFDSMSGYTASDELVIPFKNLINEAYCRDISVKVRSQLEVKRRKGDFMAPFAVYGYLKDPEEKNKLIVDAYAAEVVRDIFRWKLEGVSAERIADKLNTTGILSPMEYKKSIGLNFASPLKRNAQAKWSAGAILRILKNRIYIGLLEQGKETTPSFKVKKRVKRPQSEWAVVENTHEAIISQADFESVQQVLALDTRTGPEENAVYLFSGLVFCGSCGASMIRKTVPSGGRKYVYYVCSANKTDKTCSPHSIRDIQLEALVFGAVRQQIHVSVDLQTMLDMAEQAPLAKLEGKKLQRQLDKKLDELKQQEKLKNSLYENLTDGIIDREEYHQLKDTYNKRCKEAEQQVEALQTELRRVLAGQYSGQTWMDDFQKNQGITSLDRALVAALVERIFVYDNNRLELLFRWHDWTHELQWERDAPVPAPTAAHGKEAV